MEAGLQRPRLVFIGSGESLRIAKPVFGRSEDESGPCAEPTVATMTIDKMALN